MQVRYKKPNNVVIPDNFYIPPGTEGFVRQNGDTVVDDSSDPEDGPIEVYDATDTVGESTAPVPVTLMTPTGIAIVGAQFVRTGIDGTQVVDVLIQIDDVPGATGYDVRLTPN